MPATTNESSKASQGLPGAVPSSHRDRADAEDADMGWLEFPLAVVSCLLVPRLWLDDAQVVINGGSVGLLAGLWSGFFFVLNLALGVAQLRLFFGRLSREGRAASLKDKT